ncbi:MAG: glycosyltransferase family 9 protein, partial [Bdellovibrionales bacterium]|nr:glycosyltransferase family 9 protein [Bdellovibrionales bacterium]
NDANGSSLFTKKVNRLKKGHAAQRFLSILKDQVQIENLDQSLKLEIPNKKYIKNEIQSLVSNSKDIIVVYPGSAWKTKRWPASYYKELVKYLHQSAFKVLVLGSAKEIQLCDEVAGEFAVSLAGKTSLIDTIWIMSNAKACICNDSLGLHLASALQVPTLAIYCSTIPEFGFGPWMNRSSIVQLKGLPCIPCGRHGRNTCPTGTELCSKGLLPQDVFNEFCSLMSFDIPPLIDLPSANQ